MVRYQAAGKSEKEHFFTKTHVCRENRTSFEHKIVKKQPILTKKEKMHTSIYACCIKKSHKIEPN